MGIDVYCTAKGLGFHAEVKGNNSAFKTEKFVSSCRHIGHFFSIAMDISEAIAAPRVHHQWLPDRLRLEQFGFAPEVVDALEEYGHRVSISRSSRSQGRAMGIMVDQVTRTESEMQVVKRNALGDISPIVNLLLAG